MFVSIIIPVYNSGKYLRDCLDSCYEQDIDEEEYEIICVDDCSSDNSIEVIREYKKQHNNLKLIIFKSNRGASAARNMGMERMKGEYCMFLDSDDYIEENCLHSLKTALKDGDPNTVLCFGQFQFTETGNKNRKDNISNGTYVGCPTERYVTNRLIPISLVKDLRFQEGIAYGEDEVLSLEIDIKRTGVIKIEKPIYYYRRHSDSAMGMTPEKRIKRIESLIKAAEYMRLKYGNSSKEINTFIDKRIRLAVNEIMQQRGRYRYKYLLLIVNKKIVNIYVLVLYLFRTRAKYIKRILRTAFEKKGLLLK